MTRVNVTVVIAGSGPPAAGVREAITSYLESTGLTFEVLTPEGPFGASLRRGVGEGRGEVFVVVDPRLPYPASAIGDAVAMVESGGAEIVLASRPERYRAPALLRWMLVSELPDPTILLAAFSSAAARTAVGETRLNDSGAELEISFLGNKYGFRTEFLVVRPSQVRRSSGGLSALISALRVRLANRRNVYRAARRCPVCFSPEVWSVAAIPGNVVRACRRCKCRYLNQFADPEGTQPVRRVLQPHRRSVLPDQEPNSPSREKTGLRRYHWVRRQLPARARVLEVGVRDGSFGAAASGEYEYVGIDPASVAARNARARGLEVYCASLASFVNTGPAFDAITLFHVFENMPDPHDALGRITELLKPGGVLFLSTLDTEGLLYLISEKKRMSQNFRTRLILYSRSALIELLEHSGFEIIDIGPDFEYRDHRFLRHWMTANHPRLAPLGRFFLRLLPDPAMITTGSMRIIARRRSGNLMNLRAIRSAEPTHAR